MYAPHTCDVIWLPPCPSCSWIMLSRRPVLDRMEPPAFFLARNTTLKYGRNYFMLRGCSHATNLGLQLGPRQNRLKLAIAWRKKAAALGETLWRVGYTAEQREEVFRRLAHPEYPEV